MAITQVEVKALHVLDTWPPNQKLQEVCLAYSALKHGDIRSIENFAIPLADAVKAWTAYDEYGMIGITSPPCSNKLRSAASYLSDAVVDILCREGALVNRLTLPSPITGDQVRAQDYAKLSQEERKAVQRCRYQGIGNSVAKNVRRLVVINDARITGAQENSLSLELDKSSAHFSLLWLYIIRTDPMLALSFPAVEHAINTIGIQDPIDLVRFGATRKVAVTARLARRVLGLEEDMFERLIARWPRNLTLTLRSLALEEGLGQDDRLMKNLDRLGEL